MSWKRLLWPLTPLYAAVVRARAAGYAAGVLPSHRLDVPVVSVGNLTFGGTGKTPTVIALARDLIERGARPAVLTRGYGRATTDPLVVIGPEPGLSPEATGDEPLEMARRLPGVPVVVDGDRVRGGRMAVEAGANVLLLDDGFQHLRLARDLDVVLVDAGDPWGGGRLPPRGRLREPLRALSRASVVVVTKLSTADGTALADIERVVAQVAGDRPVLTADLRVSRVRTEDGWREPAALSGRRVLAFAGLARPEGFARLLVDSGAEVVASRWFEDHHPYTSGDVAEMVAQADRLDAVPVTTGKDAVKLSRDVAAWVVEAEMVPGGEDGWQPLLRLLPRGGS